MTYFTTLVIFLSAIELLVQEISSECSIPFQEYAGECYYFSFPATANFIGAQEYCEQMGATLAILDTQEKNSAIESVIQDYDTSVVFFIGGYNFGHDNKYYWNGIGTQFTYTNWYYKTSSSGDYCVGMSSSWYNQWSTVSCTLSNSFICQELNTTCYDSAAETSCSGSYNLVHGKCYDFVTQKSLTWLQAKEYCERRGSVLAIVDSKETNDGIASVVSANFNSHNFWIGAYDQSHEGTWIWDGKGTNVNDSYTNWVFDQPDGGSVENCALIGINSMSEWEDSSCNEEYNFICQQLPETCAVTSVPDVVFCPGTPVDEGTTLPADTTAVTSVGTTPTTAEGCDPPFANFGGGCFLVQPEDNSDAFFTWQEAADTCRIFGFTIAYILNREEWFDLMEYMRSQTYSDGSCTYWIGLNDQNEDSIWEWEGIDMDVHFTAWQRGFPAGASGNCAYMNTQCPANGLWANYYSCDQRYRLLCRK